MSALIYSTARLVLILIVYKNWIWDTDRLTCLILNGLFWFGIAINIKPTKLMSALIYSTAWLVLILIVYKNRIWVMERLTYIDPTQLFDRDCYKMN